MSFDLRAENAYYGVPLPRLSFAEIFPEEFRGLQRLKEAYLIL
jgi:hypothetical protein